MGKKNKNKKNSTRITVDQPPVPVEEIPEEVQSENPVELVSVEEVSEEIVHSSEIPEENIETEQGMPETENSSNEEEVTPENIEEQSERNYELLEPTSQVEETVGTVETIVEVEATTISSPSSPSNQLVTSRISQSPSTLFSTKKPSVTTHSFSITHTPSVIKSDVRTLLKRFDSPLEDVKAAEDLCSLCLFQANRTNILDTGIITTLVLSLKTKSNRFKGICARTLQLFAQDGGEACLQMKRSNLCNSLLELLAKTDDLGVQVPVVGLIYWLLQNPDCKKELFDLGAETYLRDFNDRVHDPTLAKYLAYALNSFHTKVKSREELLNEILSAPIRTDSFVGAQNTSHVESFRPSFEVYATPSPRHFFNLFKTPAPSTNDSRTYGSEARRLDFSISN